MTPTASVVNPMQKMLAPRLLSIVALLCLLHTATAYQNSGVPQQQQPLFMQQQDIPIPHPSSRQTIQQQGSKRTLTTDQKVYLKSQQQILESLNAAITKAAVSKSPANDNNATSDNPATAAFNAGLKAASASDYMKQLAPFMAAQRLTNVNGVTASKMAPVVALQKMGLPTFNTQPLAPATDATAANTTPQQQQNVATIAGINTPAQDVAVAFNAYPQPPDAASMAAAMPQQNMFAVPQAASVNPAVAPVADPQASTLSMPYLLSTIIPTWKRMMKGGNATNAASGNKQAGLSKKKGGGTTRHIKEIFIGRCYEYMFTRQIKDEQKEWDCGYLWQVFSKAFRSKDPCGVTQEDYGKFLDVVDEELPRDRALMWSGSREMAHKYSDLMFTKKFVTLEDTMAGFLVNGLTWCGQLNSPGGINFDYCPWECGIQTPFWSEANKRFARKLSGTVRMILNGTRMHINDGKIYPSYMKTRYYLGPYMVPNLNRNKITRVIIYVGHTLAMQKLESCGEKTIKELQDDITNMGITVECHDDPDFLQHLKCSDNPEAAECTLLKPTNLKSGGEKNLGESKGEKNKTVTTSTSSTKDTKQVSDRSIIEIATRR